MSAPQFISFVGHPLPGSRKMIRPLVVGFVLGAMLLGSVASVAARPGGHKLTILFHGTSYHSTQADPSSNVYRPGDETFLGATVLRFASPHDQLGDGSLFCAATGADGSTQTCLATVILPEGKIVAETLFETNGDWIAPSRKLAITGGTGAYRFARGELTVTTLASGDEIGVFDFGN